MAETGAWGVSNSALCQLSLNFENENCANIYSGSLFILPTSHNLPYFDRLTQFIGLRRWMAFCYPQATRVLSLASYAVPFGVTPRLPLSYLPPGVESKLAKDFSPRIPMSRQVRSNCRHAASPGVHVMLSVTLRQTPVSSSWRDFRR